LKWFESYLKLLSWCFRKITPTSAICITLGQFVKPKRKSGYFLSIASS